MSELRKTFITDAISGDTANVKENVNTTKKELLVNQEGHQCTANSTVAQLDPDEAFTGSSWQDTLDYGVLSINVASDVDSATDGLDIQWSNNGTDIADHDYFTILADKPKTFTFGPAERYYRIVYTNGSDDTTTTFHLTSLLRRGYVKPSSHRITDSIVGEDDAELVKAVLTGIDEDGIFRNIKATKKGSQAINLVDNYEFVAENTPMGEMRVATPIKMVGSAFDGTTVDPNFWTTTVTLGGTVTQVSGQLLLQTNTTANATTKVESIARGEYSGGCSLRYRAVVQLTDGETGTANNVRRWGAYDADNGAFFELDGTTFNVVTRKGGVDTAVASGSWNGESFTLDLNVHTYEIYWTNSSVWFVIGDEIVHKVSATTTTWAATMSHKISAENYNTNGLDTNIQLGIRVQTIYILGEILTRPRYKAISGAATTILKYGAGTLHAVVNTNNAGTATVYDNTAGSGTVIATIDTAKALGTLNFDAPFNTGLTVVTTGSAVITVTYE